MLGKPVTFILWILSIHLIVVSHVYNTPVNWTCFTNLQLSKIWEKTGKPFERNGRPIRLDRSMWLANKFGPTVSAILWKEIMGYDVIVTDLDFANDVYGIERLVNGSSDINLEVWSGYDIISNTFFDDHVIDLKNVIELHESGSFRRYGWFMPLYSHNIDIWNDFWLSWRDDETIALLSKGGSVDPSYYTSDPFIPPICLHQTCGELLALSPDWDGGVSSQIINNLYLRLRIVYVGSRLTSIIISRTDHHLPFLFGDIEPSLFSAPPRETFRILLPEFSYECYSNYTSFPNGSINCDFPQLPLKKIARGTLFPGQYFKSDGCSIGSQMILDDDDDDGSASYTDLKYYIDLFNFIESYDFNSLNQEILLTKARSFVENNKRIDGIPLHVFACDWIHQNNQTWMNWIQITNFAHSLDKTIVLEVSIIFWILVVISLFCQILLFCFKNYPVFNSTAYPNVFWFYQIVLFGIYSAFFWIVLQNKIRTTKFSCVISLPLLQLSITLVYGSLILKNYSTYCIFKRKSVDNIPSERLLVGILLVFVLYDLLVSIVRSVVDPPKISIVNTLIQNHYNYVLICVSHQDTAFILIYCIPKILFTIWGAIIGFRCSGLTFNYNESKKIAFITYIGCIESLLWFVLDYQSDPQSRIESNILLVIISITSVFLFLFFPNYWYILSSKNADYRSEILNYSQNSRIQPDYSYQHIINSPKSHKKSTSIYSLMSSSSEDTRWSQQHALSESGIRI